MKYAVSGSSGMRSPAPAGEVRHENLAREVELGLVEDPPVARSALALVERGSEFADEPRAGACVPGRGPWVGVERAADELGDDVLGGVEDVLVRGGCRRRGGGAAGLAHHGLLPGPMPTVRYTKGNVRMPGSVGRVRASLAGDRARGGPWVRRESLPNAFCRNDLGLLRPRM